MSADRARAACRRERQAVIAGDTHGDKAQEEQQARENLGQKTAAQGQPQASGADWEKAVAERDEKIAALEAQVAEEGRGMANSIEFAIYQRAAESRCLNSGEHPTFDETPVFGVPFSVLNKSR